MVKFEVGCLSACLSQGEHKGPATLVCTLETLTKLCGVFLWCAGKGVHAEARAVRLRNEVETSGEINGTGQPDYCTLHCMYGEK